MGPVQQLALLQELLPWFWRLSQCQSASVCILQHYIIILHYVDSLIVSCILSYSRPELTWRDIQYLLVYTSNPDVAIVGDRSFNGVRLVFSHSYGFGAIDAEALVTRAQHWIPVPAQQMCTIDVFTVM